MLWGPKRQRRQRQHLPGGQNCKGNGGAERSGGGGDDHWCGREQEGAKEWEEELVHWHANLKKVWWEEKELLSRKGHWKVGRDSEEP